MKKKSVKQLDTEIAAALKKPQLKRPSANVVALFNDFIIAADSYGAENLVLAQRDEGYTGDRKVFRDSEIFAKRLPDYKLTLLIDYIDEASKLPHERIDRKLTEKEAEWMVREAERIRDEEERSLREWLERWKTP